MEQLLARDPAEGRYVDEKYATLPAARLRGALTSTTPEDALLAVAKRIGGQCVMFGVVPILAGVTVLGTFGIGRRLHSATAGLIAAWLVATSPVTLSSSLEA